MPPRVAAIVLNYNGRELTLESLASLAGLRYPEVDLVVVDNGSTDGSKAAVAAAHPDVIQVEVPENRGVAHGINFGLRWGLAEGYDYLLLLNNDIEAHPELLDELVAVAERDETIGCVGPKTYYHGEQNRLWSTGGLLRFRESVTRERGEGEIDRGQYDRDEEVPYVNGCASLMRREALLAAGLWDPAYYLGVEDADWCTRAKAAGFSCWYAHRAILWHKVSRTLGVYTPGRTFHNGRSSAIYVRRHGSAAQRLSFWTWLSIAIPVAFLRELPKGNQRAAVEKWRGAREGWRVPLEEPPRAAPRPPAPI